MLFLPVIHLLSNVIHVPKNLNFCTSPKFIPLPSIVHLVICLMTDTFVWNHIIITINCHTRACFNMKEVSNFITGLNCLQSGYHRQHMKDLFVELCLTVPVRLSSLLPYLPMLMDPLVSALNGSQTLINQV